MDVAQSGTVGDGHQRWHVFVSYARASTGRWAEALHQALASAGVPTYLDRREENTGEGISEQVFEALLDARVAVVFADPVYFTRRYCHEELSAALAGYRALSRRNAPRPELEDAVQSVVVALPSSGEPFPELELLPPEVRSKNWPRSNETQKITDLVRERLWHVSRSFREQLTGIGELDELRARLHEMIAIPLPRPLSGIPVYHESGMPPSLGSGFVGRARELWELHEALAVRQGRAAALTAALEGGGGFGKTRLALEYVHRYGPLEYQGGLFWVNADVPEDRLEAQQHGILRLLRPDVPELAAFRESGREVAAELGEALRQVAMDRRILYVVDNVPEPQGDRKPAPLRTWCPAPGQVSLLLTSRSRTVVGGIHALAVRELPGSDAVRLLLRGYENRHTLPESRWRQVAAWVGEWPLALELLNASLLAGAVSPPELWDAIGAGPLEELERQAKALRGAVAPGALQGVVEALRMSYNKLPEPARRAARQLALLGPNPIPVRLVSGLESWVRVQLRVRSFVSDVHSADVEMYGRMHRVLADFLRGEIADPDREMRETCDVLLHAMTWDAAADPAAWPLMNACRPHAEVLIDRHAAVASDELVECMVRLCSVVGRLLRKQGRVFDEDRVRPASRSQPGQVSAVQRLEPCVELARRRLGPEHPMTLTATANLAWAMRAQGDAAAARELQEPVLRARQDRLGDEHPDTLHAMRNLALMLWDQGELAQARELQERILEVRQRLLGDEHTEALWDMSSLALTLRDQGQLAEARALQERVLRVRQERTGREHPDTLWALASLAQTLRAEGGEAERERARELEERVLTARRRLLGEDHPETLAARIELARTLLARGSVRGARSLLEQVVDAGSRRLGDDHPYILQARRELARL